MQLTLLLLADFLSVLATAVALPHYFEPSQNCTCYSTTEYKIKERFACPEPRQENGMICPEIECARGNVHTETIPPPHPSCATTSTMTIEQDCQTTCPGCFTSTTTETGCPLVTETVMGPPIECAMCEGIVAERSMVTPAPPPPDYPFPRGPPPVCGCPGQQTTTVTVDSTCPPCTPLTPIEPTPLPASMMTTLV